jgi:hypothetical protein
MEANSGRADDKELHGIWVVQYQRENPDIESTLVRVIGPTEI